MCLFTALRLLVVLYFMLSVAYRFLRKVNLQIKQTAHDHMTLGPFVNAGLAPAVICYGFDY